MTCIVGLEWNNAAFIGGDLQGTGGNHSFQHTQPKIFERGGVLFGYTTSYRFGQIIENHLQDPLHVPENRNDVYYWICQELVPKMIITLEQNNWGQGGTMLLAVHGQLWTLQSDFSVLRSVEGYNAVGSGYEYALGSLHTYIMNQQYYGIPEREYYNDTFPEQMIKDAISAAAFFSPSVGKDSVVKKNQ